MTERVVPEHDAVILRSINHEDVSPGGLVLPQPGDYEELKTEQNKRESARNNPTKAGPDKRRTNRYEVLAVGPGLYMDVADDLRDGVFLRRPMHCKAGDIVIAEEGPKPFPCNGEVLYCAKDWQILARIDTLDDGGERITPLNDYVMAEPRQQILTSAGGIYMPGQDDATGNQRLPLRFEAKEVSEGPWCLRWERGRSPGFERRPMSVKTGDTFLFDGTGFISHIGGAPRIVVQNYMICMRLEAA